MINNAQENDFEEIYKIGETFQENFRSIYNLEELTKNEYFNIITYKNEEIIDGFLIYTNLYNTIDILDIVVKEDKRNLKIGTNLMDYLITDAMENAVIYLEVATDNAVAIKLYEKFGFKIIHKRENYYKDKDAYVMERVVNHD